MAYATSGFGQVIAGKKDQATVGVTNVDCNRGIDDDVSIIGSFFESVDKATSLITVADPATDVDIDADTIFFDEKLAVTDLSEGITRSVAPGPDGVPAVYHHDYVRVIGAVADSDSGTPVVRVVLHDRPEDEKAGDTRALEAVA